VIGIYLLSYGYLYGPTFFKIQNRRKIYVFLDYALSLAIVTGIMWAGNLGINKIIADIASAQGKP
jgi:hypothetical protein